MADPARFWNARADGYSRRPVKDMDTYHRTLDCTRKYLSEDDRVLEIGCGTGTTALLLAPSVQEILATDFSSRMIEIARDKAEAQGVPNARFECVAVGEDLTRGQPFDRVLAFNLLHLIDDLPAAIRSVHAQLRPGGLFISKSPCLGERAGLLVAALAILRVLGLAPRVHRLRAAELEEMIAAEGFEIAESDFHPASGLSRFIVARRK